MNVSAFLGVAPTVRITWGDLFNENGPGVPVSLYDRAGLYAIYKGEVLLYVGHSSNLSRRLGQAIGAICGGGDLHSGGYRIFCEWSGLPSGDLTFEVYEGDEAYDREAETIVALRPPLNGRQR